MYDFVAVDFETATPSLGSACAVGLVAIKDFEIVDHFYSLIQPPDNMFFERNIDIHGITPDATEHAKSFAGLWPEIERFFDVHTPVVAHNAGFDMSVLRASFDGEIKDFVYVDTMTIAATLFERRWSLVETASLMGIDLEGFNHHNALEDAWVCALIMKGILERFNCCTVWELLTRNIQVGRKYFSELGVPSSIWYKRKSKPLFERVRPSDIHRTAPVDENSPLYGKSIVFTGQLSIERADAMQLAVNAGACVKTGVSRKTDILVVGGQDLSLVGDDGMSTKEERAHALNDAGEASIAILSEEQFMSLLKEKELT